MAMNKRFSMGALAGVSVAVLALAGAGAQWPAAMADGQNRSQGRALLDQDRS